MRTGKSPTAVGGVSRAASCKKAADPADGRGDHDANGDHGQGVAQSCVGVVLQPFYFGFGRDDVHIEVVDEKVTARAADHAAQIGHSSRERKTLGGVGDIVVDALEQHGEKDADGNGKEPYDDDRADRIVIKSRFFERKP